MIIPARTTGKLREGATPPTTERMESHGKEIPQKAAYKPKRVGNWRNEGPAEPNQEGTTIQGDKNKNGSSATQQVTKVQNDEEERGKANADLTKKQEQEVQKVTEVQNKIQSKSMEKKASKGGKTLQE